ncbi:unnamed protein product [Schistosoma turkestanicum]|nr:unnamed protein product [Schistosoma turkestanicum]
MKIDKFDGKKMVIGRLFYCLLGSLAISSFVNAIPVHELSYENPKTSGHMYAKHYAAHYPRDDPLAFKRTTFDPILFKRNFDPILFKRNFDPILFKRNFDPILFKRSYFDPIIYKRSYFDPILFKRNEDSQADKRGYFDPIIY